MLLLVVWSVLGQLLMIHDSYTADIAVFGNRSNIGGLIGSLTDGQINRSYVVGSVVSTTTVTSVDGGLMGGLGGIITNSEVRHSYVSDTDIDGKGSTQIGGLGGLCREY